MAEDKAVLKSSVSLSTEPIKLERGASDRGNLSAMAAVVAG